MLDKNCSLMNKATIETPKKVLILQKVFCFCLFFFCEGFFLVIFLHWLVDEMDYIS